ncbi:YjbF family lipoprotein [Pseudaestuariivita rosea]|uniref:YjbF family lipoprotein n=1 Tax=Pseudaestuariivita rosea TaxID=2763263 RepID=UPI001ABB6BA5|nr:YjbF family lipoprotein [Pseudaestuariivita rosea]
MITKIRRYLVCAALVFATGCSGGTGVETSPLLGLTTTLREAVRQSMSGPTNPGFDPATSVTAVQAANYPGRTWVAHLEERQAWGTLALLGQNRDVLTYLTEDAISISLRRGVLVATRGLGDDVLVANPNPTLRALNNRGQSTYTRRVTFLDGTSQRVTVQLNCTMRRVGQERITIAQTTRGSDRYSETCAAENRTIQNTFWTANGNTVLLKTRQWVSEDVGYLDTYLMKP